MNNASATIDSALAALVTRYALTTGQGERLAALLSNLATDELAPTTIKTPENALDVHIADALCALDIELVRDARQVGDLGSGAGFPGLPLAISLPSASFNLIESQTRKCAFMERAIDAAAIRNAQVIARRAEDWPQGIGAHDLLLARAIAPQPVVLEYAAPLLRVGGMLVDWRGRREQQAESEARDAATMLGMSLLEIRHPEPYAGARDHHLHLYLKVEETPELFPRRPGMARKRPIAAIKPMRNRARTELIARVGDDLRPRSTLA